jgi:hypothetical protein
MKCVLLSVLCAGGLLTGAAFAESDLLTRTLTAEDLGRLADFARARAQSIAEAREGGAPADIAVLDDILAGEEEPILGIDIRGDYRCRVAKLGGEFGKLTIYDWFRCEISEDSFGYRLEKTSGSQRLSGHFIDDSETSLVFFGAGHYDDESPREYNADAERNIVGRFVRVTDDRYRLEMPLPKFESTFDILELEKR